MNFDKLQETEKFIRHATSFISSANSLMECTFERSPSILSFEYGMILVYGGWGAMRFIQKFILAAVVVEGEEVAEEDRKLVEAVGVKVREALLMEP